MSLRDRLGLDGFDLVLHGVVTVAVCAIASGFFLGPAQDTAVSGIVAISAIVLGIRRRFALRAAGRQVDAGRLLELEERLDEMDLLSRRVAELEERLDFTERLLVRHREDEALRPGLEESGARAR
jgi:hypothetical protein